MELPFCKICGDRHRLGFCPEFGPIPPSPPPVHRRDRAPDLSTGPVPVRSNHETNHHQPPQGAEEEGPATAAQDQRGALVAAAEAFRFTPEDMKQESLSPKQYFAPKRYFERPRFDKRAYQRDLMRKRRAKTRPPRDTQCHAAS